MATMKSLQLVLLTITATSALFDKAFLLHEQPFAVQREQALPGNGNCVDVSRWGEVQYNTTTDTVCSFTVNRVCTPREEEVCTEVATTECHLETGSTCETEQDVQPMRMDETVEEVFQRKRCYEDGVKLLTETKKMPVCVPVTKQQCDSQWETRINEETGEMEKVWAGNENCREVTWEDCKLVDTDMTEEVPVKTCVDDGTEPYITKVEVEADMMMARTVCGAVGGPVCEVTRRQECTTVTWTDCEEEVVPSCTQVSVNIPFQEFDHLLRCNVDH